MNILNLTLLDFLRFKKILPDDVAKSAPYVHSRRLSVSAFSMILTLTSGSNAALYNLYWVSNTMKT